MGISAKERSAKDASDYTDDELCDICAVDNGWAAEELRERIHSIRLDSEQLSLLISELLEENA